MTDETNPDPQAVGPDALVSLARAAHLQRLLDVYGPLLTDHQREACRLHLDEDWSFAELAENFGCSRSGAHDLVRRALLQLEHLEARLGLAAELSRRDALEAALRSRLGHRLADLRAAEVETTGAQPGPGPALASPVPRAGTGAGG